MRATPFSSRDENASFCSAPRSGCRERDVLQKPHDICGAGRGQARPCRETRRSRFRRSKLSKLLLAAGDGALQTAGAGGLRPGSCDGSSTCRSGDGTHSSDNNRCIIDASACDASHAQTGRAGAGATSFRHSPSRPAGAGEESLRSGGSLGGCAGVRSGPDGALSVFGEGLPGAAKVISPPLQGAIDEAFVDLAAGVEAEALVAVAKHGAVDLFAL